MLFFWDIYLLVARFVWFRCFLEFLLGGFGVSTEMLAKGKHHHRRGAKETRTEHQSPM